MKKKQKEQRKYDVDSKKIDLNVNKYNYFKSLPFECYLKQMDFITRAITNFIGGGLIFNSQTEEHFYIFHLGNLKQKINLLKNRKYANLFHKKYYKLMNYYSRRNSYHINDQSNGFPESFINKFLENLHENVEIFTNYHVEMF